MAKNSVIKKYEPKLDDDFDFSADDSSADGMFAGMVSGLIEASNHQTTMAIELTKLVVLKNPDCSMTEDKIFSTFKKATKVIADSFPLKSLMEQCG